MGELKLFGKVILKGKIQVKTGLHIGGAQGKLEIGGLDNAVIRDVEGKPYIPGSSLKGKMRSLLEQHEDKLEPGMHLCDNQACPVCVVFGSTHTQNRTNITPTRIQVRDAFLDTDSLINIKDKLDLEYTEVKFENSIDRITSAANPRQQERVPRGAEFDFEIVFNILCEEDKKMFKKVLIAMKLLEDDYLGGAGSRGSGKIEFNKNSVIWNSREAYETGELPGKMLVEEKPLKNIMETDFTNLLK